MAGAAAGPSGGRRAAAWVAVVVAAVLVGATVLLLLDSMGALLLGLASSAALVLAGWWAVLHRGLPRALGVTVAVVAVGGLAVSLTWVLASLAEGASITVGLVATGALGLVASRLAVGRDLYELPHAAPRVARPAQPVLICNERSGGGKVVEFDLIRRARERGVEVVVLSPGDDLTALARDAVDRGADCLAMAGGDGSQALVAAVAAQAGIPFVCIAAGTRNHFARDLGIDPADPSDGLDAFADGRRRVIDYGMVGERLFVNNVSIGAYASIVQSPEYRDAKLGTSMAMLPDLVGGGAAATSFDLPDGTLVADASVVLVSNNPYVLGLRPDAGTRSSLTSGRLGVVALRAATGADALRAVAGIGVGGGGADSALMQFDTTSLTVDSPAAEVDVAIDGEALTLATPLQFTVVPAGPTVLVADDAARGRRRHVGLGRILAIAAGRAS